MLANSALMFGYARPDWRDGYAGWEYIDTIADDNQRARGAARSSRRARRAARSAAPPTTWAACSARQSRSRDHLTRAGIADGLRRVKQLPATSGYEGTLMGFGMWEHAALKGHYLVLREWKDGRSVQVRR